MLPINDSIQLQFLLLDFKKEHEIVDNWNKGIDLNLDIYSLLYDMEVLQRIILKKDINQRIPQDYNEDFVKKKGIKILFVHLLSQLIKLTLELPNLRVIRYVLTCMTITLKTYKQILYIIRKNVEIAFTTIGEKEGLVSVIFNFIEKHLDMCHPNYGLDSKKIQCINKCIKAGIIFLLKFGSLNESSLEILQKENALSKLLCKCITLFY